MSDEIERLKHVYSTRYRPDPQDQEYVWHPLNPTSIYYRQAQERAIANLMRKFKLPIPELKVLDVGCGIGNLLRYLISLGVPPAQLHGIDLMDYRIEAARSACPPDVKLHVGNAELLPYPDHYFDLVTQFTLFSSILNPILRQNIAREMSRMVKKSGYLLWYDMYNVRVESLHGLKITEVKQLFPGFRVVYQRKLHPWRASQIVKRSRFVCEALECLPFWPKTHYLLLLQYL